MPYWVHGTDNETGEPAEMLSDAETQGAAIEQALDQGIRAERIMKAADPRRAKREAVTIRRPGLVGGLLIGTAIGMLVAVLWGDVALWVDKNSDGVLAAAMYLSLPAVLLTLGCQHLWRGQDLEESSNV